MRLWPALLLALLSSLPAWGEGLAVAPLVDAVPAPDATGRRALALDGRLRAVVAARGLTLDSEAHVSLAGRVLAAAVEDATDIEPFVNVWKPIHLAFAKVELSLTERVTGKRLAAGVFAEEAKRDRARFAGGADLGPGFAESALGCAVDAALGRGVETLCKEAGIRFTPVVSERPDAAPVVGLPEGGLFADDFSGAALGGGWQASEPAQWSVAGGVLHVAYRGGGPTVAAGDASWADVAVEWRMRRLRDAASNGHAGIKLRRSSSGELYLFMRPRGLRFAGFGRTESDVSPRRMEFRQGDWHHFRVELRGDTATINVDGQAIGSVGGITNRSGGIAFAAYQEDAEFDDLRVIALPKAAEAGPRAPAPPPEERTITVAVADPRGRPQQDCLVTTTAAALGLRPGTAIPAVEAPVPVQYDDLDGDGRVSPDDEVAFRIAIPAGGPARLALRFGPGVPAVRAAQPGLALEGSLPGAYTVTGRLYRASGDTTQASFALEFPKGGVRLFSLRPWKGEKVVCAAAGPARVVLCSEMPVANNGRVRRVVSVDAETVAMRHTLCSADGKQPAFVQPTEAFWLNTAPQKAIAGTRWRDWRGEVREARNGAQFRHIFLEGAGAPSQDILLENGSAVALIHQGSPDYAPGAGFVSGHGYASGGLTFGWRPPIEVRPEAPHRNDLILCPHPPERDAFGAAEYRYRLEPAVLVGDAAVKEYADRLQRVARGLRAGLSAAGRAVPRGSALHSPDGAGVCDTLLASLQTRRREVERLAAKRPVEVTPIRALLLQGESLAAAARIDFALERLERGAERLAEAAALAARADALAKSNRLAARLLPAVPPGSVVPYVTFSEGADDRMLALGFDVAHFWLPWTGHFDWDIFEPEPGKYRMEVLDARWKEVAKPGVRLIPLVNFAPPRWYTGRYGSNLGSLVDPKMLGEVPQEMREFERYIRTVVGRYGKSPQVLAWAVRNEPAYYALGGANTPALLRALRGHLRAQYRDVAALNAVWGTEYKTFDEVQSPRSFQENRAAWYDVMTWKARCLAGELAWEADTITGDALCKRTGAKYVPACFGPQAARSGYGVDPWLSSPPQRGVAMCDLYIDGERANALRTSEQFWGCGGVPVISPETGRASRDPDEVYRWHYTPPKRAVSFAWTLFQHGMFGTHYWCWPGGEEYSALDRDGAVGDFAVWAARMNRLFQAAGPALSRVRPRADVGLFYPRATFIQGGPEHVATYERLYALLCRLGYQPRLVSETDFAQAAPSLKAVVFPDAPYLERALLPAVRKYAASGGALLFVGVPALFDEFARPYGPEGATGLADLLGATPGAALSGAKGSVRLEGLARPVEFADAPSWRALRPKPGTRVLGKGADGSILATENVVGKGRAILVPAPLGRSFGTGTPVVELAGAWRFRFGASWPQAPGSGQTSTEGHTDRGRAEHWERPDLDDTRWDTVGVPGLWEENGYADKDGWGWYRKRFRLPSELAGKRVLLVGDSLDDRAEVWVNGARVLATLSWDQRFSVDVTPYLRCGGENTLALRIEDTCVFGGVRGSIGLVSPDLPAPDTAILGALLQRAGVRPSAAPAGGGGDAYQAVLVGPDGACLAVSNADAGRALETAYDIPAGKGEPGAALARARRGEVMNVFTGERGTFQADGGSVRVRIHLEPLGVALVPLCPAVAIPSATRAAANR